MEQPGACERGGKIYCGGSSVGESAARAIVCYRGRARAGPGFEEIETHAPGRARQRSGIDPGLAQLSHGAVAQRIVAGNATETHLVAERGERDGDIASAPPTASSSESAWASKRRPGGVSLIRVSPKHVTVMVRC